MAVPIDVVMAGEVMVGASREGVPFGGTASKQQGTCQQDDEYGNISFQHVVIVLEGLVGLGSDAVGEGERLQHQQGVEVVLTAL